MKNLSKVSTPKKVFLVGLGVLSTGTVVLIIDLQQSPALWQTFQCGYDLSLNNSSLTRDQINEYCNNQVRDAENLEDGLTTAGFGIILIVIGLLDNNCNWWWHMDYGNKKKRKNRSIIRNKHGNDE